ncbi:D-alanyl-D-alanine carboxypeptidase family protein [Serpentinicella alkaliphila]|uniref:serine-type D-Ala-D-Ala carboxypeptidase n=1 Tax=Serpentinicella alkaliphila TaxID=1734049 RepID=A0A4R2T9U7_9FIRM|nr:D-alanyl-D-alanine carboxypeptidase family protein [Serpentinicella alkaliphila]QUH26570.1 D-alanyl-D-alanine carboxypeptidase [Serpentinicella alkaliphila]TCP99055.1 D-alanyl-D-alanine carboxypeptidase (penicillin-binding protein 5/6) [Serpentinicella alkaliphila]
MKKLHKTLILTLALSLFLSIFTANAFAIDTSGAASIVIDVSTGSILYEKNIHEKLPMASTTKIMTALLAIENVAMDKIVSVNPKAQGIEGSSIYLKSNEKVKMADLVYGLMLRSGNDAATAIAYEVGGGSYEKFIELMNKRAKELGALNTNFMNPHGLYHKEHYTTAYDLAIVTREALKNPVFKEVARTKMWVAERDEFKYFSNKNKILNSYEGGDGVKTGFTKKSGRCLVASATRNNMQLVAVTLNDGNWFNTTMQLLDHSFENYSPYIQFEEGQNVKRIYVENGDKEFTYVKTDSKLIIPLNNNIDSKVISVFELPEQIEAPVNQDQVIGSILTYVDNKLVDKSDLLTTENIQKLTLMDKLKRFLFN